MLDLEERAAHLVNPASGVANDFLNHFNEILLLIENLPIMLPEMVDEILEWRPKTYREYFQTSSLPGSAATLEIYGTLSREFRADFESMVSLLNRMAVESITVITRHRRPNGEIAAEEVEHFCERAALEFRRVLARAADLVNNGSALPLESPQNMADRILFAEQPHDYKGANEAA
ncbi:MAG: hypothetical protein SGJ17_05630 [Hyphomicrobiales bacterium]|nr:hypothetical protein [Hyphomicrobiales bacterium]